MKNIFIPSRHHELWTKIIMVLNYFALDAALPGKIKKHLNAMKVLGAYRKEGLVFFRVYFIYILPYISKALSVEQKHRVLTSHYSFLRQRFSKLQLRRLFNGGIEYYNEINHADSYSIVLQAVTDHLEFEGSMNLLFKLNNICLFTLGFTFVPGNIVGCENDWVVFVSSIQGTKNEFDNIRKATRHFKDNALPLILMKALQAIAINMDIDKCLGISAKNQLSLKGSLSYEHFYAIYDVFWLNIGGVEKDGNYLISLPLAQKPILQISQPHRNRTLKKRKKLDEIMATTHKNMVENLRLTG